MLYYLFKKYSTNYRLKSFFIFQKILNLQKGINILNHKHEK